MKESNIETSNVNSENRTYSDSKLTFLEIKPKNYSVNIPDNESKPFYDKIVLKNNVRSSDSKKLELKEKNIKLNSQQSHILEFTIQTESTKNIKKSHNNSRGSRSNIALYIFLKSDLFDLKYQIFVERTQSQSKKQISNKISNITNSKSIINEDKNGNKSAMSESDFSYNNRHLLMAIANDKGILDLSNKIQTKDYSRTDNEPNSIMDMENKDLTYNENLYNKHSRYGILSQSTDRHVNIINRSRTKSESIHRYRQTWSDLIVTAEKGFIIPAQEKNVIYNNKQRPNYIEIIDEYDEQENYNEKDYEENNNENYRVQTENTDRICDLINNAKEDNKILNENYLLKEDNYVLVSQNDQLRNDNSILKDRTEMLIQKLNNMDSILQEYQLVISKKDCFSNLLVTSANEFTLYSTCLKETSKNFHLKVEDSSKLLNEKSEKQLKLSYLLENFLQSRNPEEVQQLDSITDTYYNSLKNNPENNLLNIKERNLSSISNQMSFPEPNQIIYKKKAFVRHNNDNQITKENDMIIEPHIHYNEENIKEYSENVNNENGTVNETYFQTINLNHFNENSVINSLKDRFIELEYFNFTENKRKFEAVYNIIDSIYLWIINIKNNETVDNINNNPHSINLHKEKKSNVLSENHNDFSELKKIEDLIRMFLGRLSYYKDIAEEFNHNKAIDKLSIIRKEEALFFPNDMNNLFNEIQNLSLMENELENYKLDNKKLLIEYNTLAENFSNISKEVEDYKFKVADLEREIENVRINNYNKTAYKNEIREGSYDLNEFASKLQLVEEENLMLNRSLKKCEEANIFIKKELKESRVNYAKMNDYYKEIEMNMNDTYKKFSDKDNEILNLKSQMTLKENIISNLKRILETKSNSEIKNSQFKEILNNLNKNLKEKENAINLVNSKLRENENYTDEMKNQIYRMKNQLNNYDENHRILQNEIKVLKNDNENLRTQRKLNQINPINYEETPKTSISLEKLKMQDKVENMENLLTTVVHCFSELFLKIYSLIEKTLNKSINKNQEMYYQNLSFNKKFLNDLINNTIIICLKNHSIDESLRNNNEKIYEFYKTFVEIWIKENLRE